MVEVQAKEVLSVESAGRPREGAQGAALGAPLVAVLLIGLLLWIATVGTAYLTGDVILFPSVVLLGSFLVPVTAVVWYLDHDPSPALSPRRIVAAFILAAAIGVLAAAVLESWLVFGPGPIGQLKVGLIEES
jgi:hypothetical protein